MFAVACFIAVVVIIINILFVRKHQVMFIVKSSEIVLVEIM